MATTAAGSGLPDGRRAELVSPPGKNGGDALASPEHTRAATDGDAAEYASLAAFADPLGTSLVTEYVAERSSLADPGNNGWGTRAVTPLQTSLPVRALVGGLDNSYAEFSSDLAHGVYRSWSPVTDDPMVADVPNLYVRSGLRNGASAAYSLVTGCPLCEETVTPLASLSSTLYNGFPKLAGMSDDGRHVLFESTLPLVRGAVDGTSSGAVNFYVSDGGVVQLAGVLPNDTVAADAVAGQGTTAGGNGGKYAPHVLSADGSRYIFTAERQSCSLPDSGNFTCGTLYLRDRSGTPTTVQVNASERTPADPAGPAPAIYWEASRDGSKVIFSTTEQLTNDDTNTSWDLYRFDLGAPPGQRLTRLSVQDPSLSGTPSDINSVFGASDDGDVVYFTATQQLVAGAPAVGAGAAGIFAWRQTATPGGELEYVGDLGQFFGMVSKDVVEGQNYIGNIRQTRVSSDGRSFLFAATLGPGLLSVRGGTDYDHGACTGLGLAHPGCNELYVYDAETDQLWCATCRPDGQPATASASAVVEPSTVATTTSYLNHPLAANGRWVFFTTSEALVPEDVNGKLDAYEWDRATNSVRLLSTGTDPGDSYFLDATPSGDDVFIATRAQLVGWDTDNSYDVYDLRRPAPGHPAGFPEPPAPQPVCSGDGCLGSPAGAPSAPAIVSLGFRGTGNVNPALHRVRGAPHKRCKRGMVRRRVHGHVRCVKRAARHANRRHAAGMGR